MVAFSKCTALVGNATTAGILLSSNLFLSIFEITVKSIVRAIDIITGSGKNTPENHRTWHGQRYSTEPVYKTNDEFEVDIAEIDVDATLAKSKYPIKPDELIKKCKEVIGSEFGTRAGFDPDALLADDFQFVAPIVGPLSKAEFLKAFGSFKLLDALPDFKNNTQFYVDPLEPNRVWFVTRAVGTHTGPLNLGGTVFKATNKTVYSPPQASSLLFDEGGKCYTLTAGYTMDRRIGNTGGMGALFGILKAVGKPLPFREAQGLHVPSLGFSGFNRLEKVLRPPPDDCTAPAPAKKALK